jgi:hypothetical protein
MKQCTNFPDHGGGLLFSVNASGSRARASRVGAFKWGSLGIPAGLIAPIRSKEEIMQRISEIPLDTSGFN